MESVLPNGDKIQNLKYEFDLVGNVRSYTNDSAVYSTTQSYGYDSLYQLTSVDGISVNKFVTADRNDYTATYSQHFAFSADGLCNMVSKNSRQNMQLEDDLNYDLDYEYYEGHAHLLKRAGDRWYRYDENGNLVCEQDRDFAITDGTEAVEYHAVTKEADDVYSTDYAWAAVRDSSAGKTEDDKFYKRTFEWNEDNMLIATTDNEYVTNYVYGADGERAVKKSKAGETLYFNKFFSHRFLGSIQWEAGHMSKHIFLGNERIATKVHELSDSPDYDKTDTRVEKENMYFYHSDHLGSAQTVTNGEGQLYERLEYTPYGEVWLDESAAYVAGRNDFKTPFRFTAKELDEETGLYYYGARYLDPKYSRWISTDPALAEYIPSAPINDEAKKRNQNLPGMGGIFNTTNCGLYHYAANNPVRYIDPNGEAHGIPYEVQKILEERATIYGGLPYEPRKWNSDKNILLSTNCYAYAMNFTINPITGESFKRRSSEGFALQPGDFFGIRLTEVKGEYVELLVSLDCYKIGYKFKETDYNTPVKKGNWKVALAINNNIDYHWYRRNNDGTWSHKPGSTLVTNKDGNGNIIYNPEKVVSKYEFYKFYEVGPNNDD